MQSDGLTWFSSFTFSLYDRYQQMIHTLKNTMITVVESLKNKSEEDQLRKEEMHQEKQHRQSNIQFTDNCSDSGSSFSQVTENCLQMIPINSCFNSFIASILCSGPIFWMTLIAQVSFFRWYMEWRWKSIFRHRVKLFWEIFSFCFVVGNDAFFFHFLSFFHFQSYGFFRQEQLQILAEKLDSSKPKEVNNLDVSFGFF